MSNKRGKSNKSKPKVRKQSKVDFALQEAIKVLDASDDAMSVRGVHYELVANNLIENTRRAYQDVSCAIVKGRKEGLIPWEKIIDTLREPIAPPMWDDLPELGRTVLGSYRRDVWATQEDYIEVWVEKDTLARKFEKVLRPYGVTLNVGRGFDGWTSRKNAADRYIERAEIHRSVTVLYYGDFDPSGEEMVTSLKKTLAEVDAYPAFIKCALTYEDIQRYDLPPNPVKKSDSRAKKFIEKYGEVSIELDALEAVSKYRGVLLDRLKADVEALMDLDALAETKAIEKRELEMLAESIEGWRGAVDE